MEKYNPEARKSGREVEITAYFDENGKSFDELMQELIRVFLSE